MLRFFIIRYFYLFFLALSFSGCVSVGIEKPTVSKAKNISFTPPHPPFEVLKQNDLDSAWRNPKNGNTISFLSECNGGTDPSHYAIREGIVSGVQSLNVKSQKMISFNNRMALLSHVKGTVDGVGTEFKILILKKNSCIFILTYVGLQGKFKNNNEQFQMFLDRFTTP